MLNVKRFDKVCVEMDPTLSVVEKILVNGSTNDYKHNRSGELWYLKFVID